MDRRELSDFIASRAVRQFAFHPPDAPGICFRGAVVRRGAGTASVTGLGETDEQALKALAGETAEAAAEPAIRRMDQADFDTWPARAQATLSALASLYADDLGAITGLDPVTGRERAIPALLKDPDNHAARMIFRPGIAAGPDPVFATERALLELVERDAVARWWLGGAPAAALTYTDDGLAQFQTLRKRSRADATGRTEHLLDITSDLGVPCVASYSLDADGRGFACGFAARPTHAEALASAFTEMCQMEAGLRLVALKRQQEGAQALSRRDREQEDRAAALSPASCPALTPVGSTHPPEVAKTGEGAQVLKALTHAGLDFAIADVTPPDCPLTVVRAFAPGLQPMTEALKTERFQKLENIHPGFTPASRLL